MKQNKVPRNLLRLDSIVLIVFGILMIVGGISMFFLEENQSTIGTHLEDLNLYVGTFILILGIATTYLAYDRLRKVT
ncbi:hypothetical protein [Patiriisocius marinus]|nr:hypothetical protein [Patiriisocius marinus]